MRTFLFFVFLLGVTTAKADLPVSFQLNVTGTPVMSQLMEVHANSVSVGVSKSGFPQLELSLSGQLATDENPPSAAIAFTNFLSQELGGDHVMRSEIQVGIAGTQGAQEGIHILDGARAGSGHLLTFRTKIVVEMVPGLLESLRGPAANRVYKFRFPEPINGPLAEQIFTVHYDGKTAALVP